MPGGSVEEDTGGGALVLERRGSWLIVAVAVAILGLLGAFLLGRGDDTASAPTTTGATATTGQTETTLTADDGPALTRLSGADSLPEPIWLLAGRSRSQDTMLLYRVDDTGEAVVNAVTGQGQLPGERYRAIRADDAIVWSNGDQLLRIDEDLDLIPFALSRATTVFPNSDDEVWTVDRENFIVDSPLRQDRQPRRIGEIPGDLVAPLSPELLILRVQGGVGIWTPGLAPSYVATNLLGTSTDLAVFSTVQQRMGTLLSATTSPFAVTATVPLDVEGIPLGDGALSPDGRQIAFHLQRGARIELVVADVTDGTTTLLGIFTDRAAPVWLDDGRLVVIGAPAEGRQLVWLVSPGTDEPSQPVVELDAGRAWTLAVPTQ